MTRYKEILSSIDFENRAPQFEVETFFRCVNFIFKDNDCYKDKFILKNEK